MEAEAKDKVDKASQEAKGGFGAGEAVVAAAKAAAATSSGPGAHQDKGPGQCRPRSTITRAAILQEQPRIHDTHLG